MHKLLSSVLLLFSLVVVGCQHNKGSQSAVSYLNDTVSVDSSQLQIRPHYAQGFTVAYRSGICLVDIHDPQLADGEVFRYALVKRGAKPADVPAGYTIIETPVRSVICMTTLQLSNFIKLSETSHVVGVTSTRHLFNKQMNAQIENGQTRRIGIEGNFNNEMVMALDPGGG